MSGRDLTCLSGTFTICAGLAALWNGCTCYDCDCPELPPRPPALGPLQPLEVLSGRSVDAGSEPPTVAPESGTIEITGDTLVITYRQAEQDHRVVYAIMDPS